MRISDNSVTDKPIELVDSMNINARLRALGVDELSVDRICQPLILDWLGMEPEMTGGMSYREVENFLKACVPAHFAMSVLKKKNERPGCRRATDHPDSPLGP